MYNIEYHQQPNKSSFKLHKHVKKFTHIAKLIIFCQIIILAFRSAFKVIQWYDDNHNYFANSITIKNINNV